MDNDFTNSIAEADKNKDFSMQEFECFHRSDNLLCILKSGIIFFNILTWKYITIMPIKQGVCVLIYKFVSSTLKIILQVHL